MLPLTPNCRCVLLFQPPPMEDDRLREERRKFEAWCALNHSRKELTIPTYDEWIGLNLLERDDQLPPSK